jgi:hypothetical protein
MLRKIFSTATQFFTVDLHDIHDIQDFPESKDEKEVEAG